MYSVYKCNRKDLGFDAYLKSIVLKSIPVNRPQLAREPGKIYHVCDVGVEALKQLGAQRTLTTTQQFLMAIKKIDDLSVATIALLTRSPEAIIR